MPGIPSLSTTSLSGSKSSKESGIPIYLTGSIATEQSKRTAADGYASCSLLYGEGCAISGKPRTTESPCFSSRRDGLLWRCALPDASSAMSARSAAGHVYGFLIILLLNIRAAYPRRVPIKRVDKVQRRDRGLRPAKPVTIGRERQRLVAPTGDGKEPRHRRDCRQ